MNQLRIKDFLFKSVLVVAVITFAIALTILMVPIFEISLSLGQVPEQVGMARETIMENYYILLEYLHFPWVNELIMPDFPTSASGAFHFYEVKILFYINYTLLLISLPISIYYLWRLKRESRLYTLKKPAAIAAWVPIGLLVFLAINFDYMFVLFHEIVFNNDAWLFNPQTDPIINVLTQDFFMMCFIFAFVVIEILFIAGYLVGKRDLKKKVDTM